MAIDWFPLWLSLKVAAIATGLSLLVGLWLVYLMANRNFRGKGVLSGAVTLPLVLPPTVLGYYLLVLVGRESPLGGFYERVFGSPLVFTWQGAVVAAMLQAIPLLVISARAALASVEGSYERAARSLGASNWRVFWRVSLPLARRSILAAAWLAFARSLGDFGITLIIAGHIPGRTQTLGGAVYEAVEGSNGGLARALVLVISVLAAGILWGANRLVPRQESG
jgi:molybdate transport system permease protein